MDFNEGLRPHFDPIFDEAIELNEKGIRLELRHKEAIVRNLAQFTIPAELLIDKPLTIFQPQNTPKS